MADTQVQALSPPAIRDSRQLHILHVVRYGHVHGGMENGIVNVANRLPSERFRVSVCSLDREETFSKAIRKPDSQFYVVPKLAEGIEWGLVRRLARVFRQSGADIIHSHNWGTFLYAVLAAKLAGLPIIHGEHGKNPGEERESSSRRLIKKLLGRRLNALHTVSNELAREWSAHGIKNIVHIPNGVDSERFVPHTDKTGLRSDYGLPVDGFLIGSIGRMDVLKNFESLIDAHAQVLKAFPDATLAFLGKGPEEKNLQDQAARLGIAGRVLFLGRRNDPERFLAALDVFALPSKSEGMSNVVLEAMSVGLPLVCAELPSHLEVFEAEKEAISIPDCTSKKLAEALIALLQDEARRISLGKAARSKILERFSIQRMVDRYADYYESVFAASGGAK